MPTWAWALIALGAGLVVGGIVVAAYLASQVEDSLEDMGDM